MASISPQSHAISYRKDIDGLRAVAILPILLLHCGVTSLRGGFVGVDIFFVISGYLITSIIQTQITGNYFDILQFYRRRIVRILPALFAVIVACLIAACFLMLPVPLRNFGHSMSASALFGSNIYFYSTTNYFANSAEMEPLIHNWSLSIEEQFYFLFPFLLILIRHRSNIFKVSLIAAISILSFCFAYLIFDRDASAAFYLLPARAWELGIGALIAFGAFPKLKAQWLRSMICWAALVGIALCLFFVSPHQPFPAPYALFPVLGTAALLAYAPGTSSAALLSFTPLRWIGLISYSLYLWHRPIIAFYLINRPVTLESHDTALLIAASFAAAIASYAMIERPAIRRWKDGTGLKPHCVAIVALMMTAIMGWMIANNANSIRPLPPEVAKIASYVAFEESPAGRAQFDTDRCFMMPTGPHLNADCLKSQTGRDNILLFGDSHAGQLSQALKAALAPAHLIQATAAGCRPLPMEEGTKRCRSLKDLVFKEFNFDQVSTVILAARWFESDIPPIQDAIKLFRSKGVKVIIVGPGLEYDAELPETLARAMLSNDYTVIDHSLHKDRARLEKLMLRELAAADATFISQFPILCPHSKCVLINEDGSPVVMDQSHLTPASARRLAIEIRKYIHN